MTETEILIVGGGPSGLMAACLLASYGIEFRLIDKKATFSANSRALIVQPRTLELFEQMGIVAEFLAQGIRAHGISLYEAHRVTDFNVYEAGADQTRYNLGLLIEQTKTEMLLNAHLARLGHQLAWETELTDLEQTANGVRVTLLHADGSSETLHARYLIAADGASSTVRKALGVAFTGETVERSFEIMDVTVDGPVTNQTLALNLNANGPIALIPLTAPGRFRTISIIPADFKSGDLTAAEYRAFLEKNFPGGLTVRESAWFSTYHIHSRSVAHFQVGDIFFVGDAAHVHTPLGGQGMNTGLQDAHNLAWKLALVLRGHLPAAALGSYQLERYPVAHRLVTTTDRLFALLSLNNPVMRFARVNLFPQLLRLLLSRPSVQRRAFPILAMINIHYQDGLLLKATAQDLPKTAPDAGTRWPYMSFIREDAAISSYELLDYAHHHLFLFAPSVTTLLRGQAGALEAWVPLKVYFVTQEVQRDAQPQTLQCDAATWGRFARPGQTNLFLVRPDAYIALAQQVDGRDLRQLLTPYFNASMGQPSTHSMQERPTQD